MADWETAPAKKSSDGWETAAPKADVSARAGEMSLEGTNGLERFAIGAGKSVSDVGNRLRQLWALGNRAADPQAAIDAQTQIDEAKQRDQALNSGWGLAGQIGGNLAMTAIPGAKATTGLANVMTRALPVVGATAAAGLVGAGMSGLTNPIATGESEAKNLMWGAGGAMAGDLASRLLSHVAQPISQTPEVKKLLAEGVVPTPGQAMGGVGRSIENKLTVIPATGEIIKSAEIRPRAEFNRAMLRKAMPDGEEVTNVGRQGLTEAKDALSGAYERVLAGHVVQPDQALATSIASAKGTTQLPLTDNASRQYDRIIEHLWQRVPWQPVAAPTAGGAQMVAYGAAGSTAGSTMQIDAGLMKSHLIADLGLASREHLRSSSAEERALGEALRAARNAVQDWTVSNVASRSPDAARKIAMIDPKWALAKQLEKASGSALANEGVFSPIQALRATKNAPNSEAFKLAEAAQKVIGSKDIANSEAGRGFLAWAAMHPSSFYNPAEYLGIPLASVLYSRPGSTYMVGGFTGQQAARGILSDLAPYAAQAGRSVADTRK